MKIRVDFVTNSSSSSFIIALNSKLNIDEKAIDKFIRKNTVSINEFCKIYKLNDKEKERVIESIKNLISYLVKVGLNSTLEISHWKLFSSYCSNEDDNYGSQFIYDFGSKLIFTREIKLRICY